MQGNIVQVKKIAEHMKWKNIICICIKQFILLESLQIVLEDFYAINADNKHSVFQSIKMIENLSSLMSMIK